MNRLLPVMILAIILAAAHASAQSRVDATRDLAPATIKGRIFDAESGETMPYTNVFLSGTNIGTMAFTDGFYILRGLRPGTYTVKASYISYAVGQETVTVGPGEVVNIDFHLEVQAIMAEPFEVAGERELIEVDRTGSAHFLSAKEMEAMPLDDVVSMIAHQPGVVVQDNQIHIRGGRADDTMFVVDGLNVSDPLAGGGYGYGIDPALINEVEVLTGGFNAEYGQAVSGIVKVTTKEGSERFEGRVSLQRDYVTRTANKKEPVHWRDLTTFNEPQNIDIFKVSLSGPDPISAGLRKIGLKLPGTQFLLASGSMDIRDGYLPIYSRQSALESPIYTGSFWSPRGQNNWNGLVKWTWNVTPTRKFSINASRQVAVSQGFGLADQSYPFHLIDHLDSALVFTNENILTQVYYREVTGETSWYEVTLGRNFSRLHFNINGLDDFRNYPVPGRPVDYPGVPRQPFEDKWHDHYVESWTAKGSWSFMGGTMHEFKTGLDLSFTEMQLVNLENGLGLPPEGKLAQGEDIFFARPITGAGFFQDTLRYGRLIVNAGLRLDWWAPGKEVEEVMASPDDYLFIDQDMADDFYASTTPFLGRRWKLRLSPRLGLSFPVTQSDKFFFNYGHFSQWPRFAYVYPQLKTNTATEVQNLGNPNLDPKVTIQYEAGVQHEFPGLWSLGVTLYNRDIYGYARSVRLDPIIIDPDDTPDPNDTSTMTIEPYRYFNDDLARSIGIELSLIKRTTRWLSGSANVEVSRTTGNNSDADAAFLQAAAGEDETARISGLRNGPLLWDKPWSVSINLDFSVFDKDRPRLFGWTMPANWSANLLFRMEAGQRYRPAIAWVPSGVEEIPGDASYDALYSATGPYTSTVNLRLNKSWNIGRNGRFTIWLEGRNLFNHSNYRRVNPWTGDGYALGDYNPDWSDRWRIDTRGAFDGNTDSEEYAKDVINPSFIENPRVVLWGVSYSW